MKNKKLALVFALAFLAAGCNPFAQPMPAGVIKTINGGVDWQFANVINGTKTTSLSSLSISQLAFDPTTDQTIYASSYTGGLYKSTDSAATWTNILSKIDLYDFAINPQNPKIIFAAGLCPYVDGNHGCVLETTDGGASWQNNPGYKDAGLNQAIRSISLNPQNPNQLIIGSADGTVIKSSDGGMTWQLLNNFSDQVNVVLWQNSNVYALLKTKGLFVQTATATGFSELTLPLTHNPIQNYIDSSNQIGSYNLVYVDPLSPTFIYITTDKGLYKTVNGGAVWSQISLPVQSTAAPARAIAVATDNSNVVYSSENSTIYKSVDGGQTWQTQNTNAGGIVTNILIDPKLPQIDYAGIYASQ